nr:MAG TPA: hypothetical protein [Caudoviricetes sp.]
MTSKIIHFSLTLKLLFLPQKLPIFGPHFPSSFLTYFDLIFSLKNRLWDKRPKIF